MVSNGVTVATFTGGLNQPVDIQFEDANISVYQIGANRFTVANPDDDEEGRDDQLPDFAKGCCGHAR